MFHTEFLYKLTLFSGSGKSLKTFKTNHVKNIGQLILYKKLYLVKTVHDKLAQDKIVLTKQPKTKHPQRNSLFAF